MEEEKNPVVSSADSANQYIIEKLTPLERSTSHIQLKTMQGELSHRAG